MRLLFLPKKKVICLELLPDLSRYGINRLDYRMRGSYLQEYSSQPELGTLELYSTGGNSFIDVGCSSGIDSIWNSKLVGNNGRIIRIDANSGITYCLVKSFNQNQSVNVRVLTPVVDSKSESLDFYANTTKPNSFSFKQHEKKTLIDKIRCQLLDRIVANLQLQNRRYIKADVEGLEEKVLLRAAKLIKVSRPVRQLEKVIGSPTSILARIQVWKILQSPDIFFTPDAYLAGPEFRQRIQAAGFKYQTSGKS
jgi:FkbM family methyltransferase